MNTNISGFGMWIGLVTFVGCAASTPPAKSASDQAAEMERTRCSATDDEGALKPVLSGSAIEKVEPLYGKIENAKGGEQPELQGAIISVRPVAGMTGEWLDRALECHSAKRVLGKIPATDLPNDPFWLPGNRTVDIDAESARDGFTVAVRGGSVADGHEILERATAFHSATASAPASN